MLSRIFFSPWVLVPALLVAVIVVSAVLWIQGEDRESSPDTVVSRTQEATFVWSMTPRFGLDANGDGRLDIPNTFEYVHNLEPGSCSAGCDGPNPEFRIELDASGSVVGGAGIEEYVWDIRGEGLASPVELRSAGPRAEVSLTEGAFEITLTVIAEGFETSARESIEVDDIVIVSLGDSYASGEGNPEVGGDPATWADDGSSDAGTIQSLHHDGAHRSGLAGPAQAALEIERADPHTSVTFVFLAASGATIHDGMTGPLENVAVGPGGTIRLQPQLEEAAEILGCDSDGTCNRDVDIMTLSIGGNDIGHAFTMGSLIALDGALLLGPVYDSLLESILVNAEVQLESLPELFDELDRGIDVFDAKRVFITGYPSPTRTVGGDGFRLCEEIAGDLAFTLEVDEVESEQAETRVLVPLNEKIEEAATTHGWTYVGSHVEEFQGHGYCGTAPYEASLYPGNPFPDLPQPVDDPAVRWFRQAEESIAIQGAPSGLFRPEQMATRGTLHPNELGHQAYKRALLDAMGYG